MKNLAGQLEITATFSQYKHSLPNTYINTQYFLTLDVGTPLLESYEDIIRFQEKSLEATERQAALYGYLRLDDILHNVRSQIKPMLDDPQIEFVSFRELAGSQMRC